MGNKPIDQLGELQRQVLELLWRKDKQEGLTVQEVLDLLHRGGKSLAYTTVLTTLQNLERSGWVKHTKSGRAHSYFATKTKSQAGATSLKQFINRAFGGKSSLLFESLVNDQKLSAKELQQLKSLIEKKQKENRK